MPAELTGRLTNIGASDLVAAIQYSSAQLAQISSCIEEQANGRTSRPLGYVVSGSLARLEALEASDIDLIALRSISIDASLVREFDIEVRAAVRARLRCDVSRGENFTGPTLLADIAGPGQIGGNADHVNLLTKRIILLTESRDADASGQGLVFRTGVLEAFNSSRSTRRRHITTLADEVCRYYRTLAIDYKSRVDHERKAWAPRYIKLRHSRKYWYFSMVMGLTSLWVKHEAYPERVDEDLLLLLQQTPTERLVRALDEAGLEKQLDVVAFYSRFLGEFRSPAIRRSLEDLEYDNRYDSNAFRVLKRNADRMHRAIVEVLGSIPANWRRHVDSRFLLSS